MKALAVVGCGNWGKNVVRTFYRVIGPRLRYVCDLSRENLGWVSKNFPSVPTTTKLDLLLQDETIEAIVVASSAPSHFEIASKALKAGKHVYVEKPMCLKTEEAEQLCRLATEKQRVLMVNHILIYHPAVTRLKELVKSKELGQVHYLYSKRVNLGTIRTDENAMWSLAPHDFSLIFYLLEGQKLESISALGEAFLNPGVQDVVFINMRFTSGQIAHFHLSWLDPHKERTLTIVGDKKMVVFDDMQPVEKLKIYDKGVEVGAARESISFRDFYTPRFGDILIPKIVLNEPLAIVCEKFVDAVENGSSTLCSGEEGLEVVRALNAAQKSMESGGKPISL